MFLYSRSLYSSIFIFLSARLIIQRTYQQLSQPTFFFLYILGDFCISGLCLYLVFSECKSIFLIKLWKFFLFSYYLDKSTGKFFPIQFEDTNYSAFHRVSNIIGTMDTECPQLCFVDHFLLTEP